MEHMRIWVNGLSVDGLSAVRGAGSFVQMMQEALHEYGNQYGLELSELSYDILIHPQFSPYQKLPFQNGVNNVLFIFDAILLKYVTYFPRGIRGTFQWFLNKRQLKKYKGILTISEQSKKDITNIISIPANKVWNVGCAAKRIFYNEESTLKNEFSLNVPNSFILYVGDITWNKNLVRLADAIKETRIPLVMVGKALTQNRDLPTQDKWMLHLHEFLLHIKGKEELFTMLGYLSDKELVAVYKKARGVVVPSLDEGFGLSWLEGALVGRPVAVSDIPIFQEITNGTSLYFNPLVVDTISVSLNTLFTISGVEEQNIIQDQLNQAATFSQENFVKNLSRSLHEIQHG